MTRLSEDADVVHSIGNDPAFLTVLDVELYSTDLPDWDYGTLTAKVVTAMTDGAAVAWGTPEGDLSIRLTMRPLDETTKQRVDARTAGRIVTSGALCLASYTSVTMCAQFDDEGFPQAGDLVFEVPAGSYDVHVHRMFRHEDGQQFGDDEPEGHHYVVVFTPSAATSAATPIERIAWALRA